MIDKYLSRRLTDKYNCLDFAEEVWLGVVGHSIRARLLVEHAFEELVNPVSPCIAVMIHDRTTPHVGVFINGKILHLSQNGVEYQVPSIAMRGFSEVRYYK